MAVESVTVAFVAGDLPPVTPGMVIVSLIALGALVLFASEVVRVDITALLVMFSLMLLGPWTRISPTEGVSGFSNQATVTILALFILSAGVQRTGIVHRLGVWMASLAGSDELRQLLVTIGVGGIPSGVLNNTPVVAMLIPAVSEMARRGGTSPSKLLMPLSYASILGGTLTLVGTSTNLLASDLAGRLLGRRLSMFAFTDIGVVVFLAGTIYIVLVGRHLVPERVEAEGELLAEYEMADYLTEVLVDERSDLVGRFPDEVEAALGPDVDLLRVNPGRAGSPEPRSSDAIEAGDALVVRVDLEALRSLVDADGLSFTTSPAVTRRELEGPDDQYRLVELVVPSVSSQIGDVLDEADFHRRYDLTVLAIRRGGELVHRRLGATELRGGDTLLVRVAEADLDRLANDPDFVVVREFTEPDFRTEKMPYAVGIVVAVVGMAALGVVELVVAALGGVVAMVVGGVLEPDELYEAVDWDVIFLLAGVIPLGIAFEQTGTANFVAALVATSAESLPTVGVLWVLYVVTVLLTALVSNAASVVLMVPIAVETAGRVGGDPFAFVLATMFAASADFMTPVGYQTNLLVYGPGGYRFTDYVRAGMPLEALLSFVTVGSIALLW